MSESRERRRVGWSLARLYRGVRRRVKPAFVRADDAVHRLAGLTVSTYDGSFPVVLPIHPDRVEILGDAAFTESCRAVRELTLLDTPRLANLWTLSRMCDGGGIIEVGSFLGGGALHLSNGSPDRRIIVCEAFRTSFDGLDQDLDSGFGTHMFTENRREDVERLFTSRGRDVLVLDGFFPASARDHELGPLSFAHIDVDVYEATLQSLNFIADLMAPRSLIVLDDHHRGARGVDRAIQEFTADQPDWISFPLFPAQALLVKRSWFDA